MANISHNLQVINENINLSKKKVGRDDEVLLVGVTKYASVEEIRTAYDSGITHIGENRVGSLNDKKEKLEDLSLNWHFVGHLQTNKVKHVIDKVCLYHSLDRFSLAEELNKRAKRNDMIVDVLIQVNIALEETKYGLHPDDIQPFIDQVLTNHPNLSIKGLMAMAPYNQNSEQIRGYFCRMNELFQKFQQVYGKEHFQYLSMGMTNDYQIAIEEGANLVRIGSAIFK